MSCTICVCLGAAIFLFFTDIVHHRGLNDGSNVVGNRPWFPDERIGFNPFCNRFIMHSHGNAIGRVHTKRSEDYYLSDATVPTPPDVQYFCSTMVENKLAHERNSFRRGMIIPNMYNGSRSTIHLTSLCLSVQVPLTRLRVTKLFQTST